MSNDPDKIGSRPDYRHPIENEELLIREAEAQAKRRRQKRLSGTPAASKMEARLKAKGLMPDRRGL